MTQVDKKLAGNTYKLWRVEALAVDGRAARVTLASIAELAERQSDAAVPDASRTIVLPVSLDQAMDIKLGQMVGLLVSLEPEPPTLPPREKL